MGRFRCGLAAATVTVALALACGVAPALAVTGRGTLCFVRGHALWQAPRGETPRKVTNLPSTAGYDLRPAGLGRVLVECASSAGDLSTNGKLGDSASTFVLCSLAGEQRTIASSDRPGAGPLGQVDTLAFSPDGNQVAFVRNGGLYVGTLSSSTRVTVLSGELAHGLEWSHDGSKLVLVVAHKNGQDTNGGVSSEQVCLFDLGSKRLRQLTRNQPMEDMGGNARIFAPHFSADDSLVGYVQGRRGDGRYLYFVRTDGSTPADASNGPTADGPFAFSRAGDAVAYSQGNFDRTSYQAQNVIQLLDHAASSSERPLTSQRGCDWDSSFSLDDQLVAFSRFPGESPGTASQGSILVASRDGSGTPRRLGAGVAPLWVDGADTDGDGLLDEWESHGIDTNGDGKIEVDLPAMGANPLHKDIFLQIDWMTKAGSYDWLGQKSAGHDHQPKQGALLDVIEAFRNAEGVSNPDDLPGINLHIDAGPDFPLNPSFPFDEKHPGPLWGALSLSSPVVEENPLGFWQGNEYDWTAFDRIRDHVCDDGDTRFPRARRRVFRYCVFAHTIGGGSGIADGIRGSQFLVADGLPGDYQKLIKTAQAGTLMHELGHTLGLRHGGGDDTNSKPNYFSIMNYNFQFTGLLVDGGFGTIDYSRSKVSTLDETRLDERTGLTPRSAVGKFGTFFDYESQRLSFEWMYPHLVTTVYSKRVDNPAGQVDWNRNGKVENPVAVDLNPGSGKAGTEGKGSYQSPLPGFKDWASLHYPVADAGVAAQGASRTVETVTEPPYSEFVRRGLVLHEYVPRVVARTSDSGEAVFEVRNAGEKPDSYRLALTAFANITTSTVPVVITLQPKQSQRVVVALPDASTWPKQGGLSVTLSATSEQSPLLSDEDRVVVRSPSYRDSAAAAALAPTGGDTVMPIAPIAAIATVGLFVAVGSWMWVVRRKRIGS